MTLLFTTVMTPCLLVFLVDRRRPYPFSPAAVRQEAIALSKVKNRVEIGYIVEIDMFNALFIFNKNCSF